MARGQKLGIFRDWRIVNPLVHKYTNARYKSWATLAEVENFLAEEMDSRSYREIVCVHSFHRIGIDHLLHTIHQCKICEIVICETTLGYTV